MSQARKNGFKSPKPSRRWTALENLIKSNEEEILGRSFPGEMDFLEDDDDDDDDKSAELNGIDDDDNDETAQKESDNDDNESEFQLDSSYDEESLTDEDLTRRDDDEDDKNRRVDELKKEGDRFCRRGQWREAIDKYDESLGLAILSTVLGNRAFCRMKLGDFQEAEKDCDAALAIDPEYKRIYRRRAALRLRHKDYYGAALDLQTLIILSGSVDINLFNEYKTLLPLARLDLFKSSDDDENPSSSTFVEMETQFVERFVDIERKAAVESTDRHLWATVVENLSMAICVAPDKSSLYAERALAHLKRNSTEAAEMDAECAFRLEPDNPEYGRLKAKIRKIQDGAIFENEDVLQSEFSTVTNDESAVLDGILLRIPVVDVYSSGIDDIRDLSFVSTFVKSKFVS